MRSYSQRRKNEPRTENCATSGCPGKAAPGRAICYTCKSRKHAAKYPNYHREWKRRHPPKPLTPEQKAQRVQKAREWSERPDVQARLVKQRADRNYARKLQVLAAYGGRCRCCSEAEVVFLTIDHVNGDGATHRRKIGGPGAFYRWLIKNDYPEGFQVLCCNCNWAKERGGCPHRFPEQSLVLEASA